MPEWRKPPKSLGFVTGPIAAIPKHAHPALAKDPPEHNVLPLYIRLPRSGTREPLTGLSRSCLNGLVLPTAANGYRPPVKSVVLKGSKSATRGCRLIPLSNLTEFLNGLLPEDHRPEA